MREFFTLRNFSIALLLLIASSSYAQLGVALNATNLTWTTSGTGGASGWSVESTVTHDGVSAAQSALLSSSFSQSSILQTTVAGPGTLTFWWRNDSAYKLEFRVGSATLASTGDLAWEQLTVYLGSGTQTLRWIFTNYPQFSLVDFNRGFVDEVSYSPGTTAPIITVQPQSQSQIPGIDARFSVGVDGTPPIGYQWRFQDVDIPGANSSSYFVTNIQSTNLGNYSVVVTNIVGTNLSSSATLEYGEAASWGTIKINGDAIVVPGATNLQAIACGYSHSLALRRDGSILSWGKHAPTNTPMGLTNIVAIAAGSSCNLALTAKGNVVAWSDVLNAQTNVPAGLSNVVQIAAGDLHCVALKADGTVVVWGENFQGQTNVPFGLADVVTVAAGSYQTLALKHDGSVIGWGVTGATNIPASVTNAVGIAAGVLHGLALRSDGTVAAWGNNQYGQTNVPPGLSNVVAIRAGSSFSVALKRDGTVVAWGDGAFEETNVPTGLTNVGEISVGRFHSLASVSGGPPILQVTATNTSFASDGFHVAVSSQSGRVYTLEYKNSLLDGQWTPLPLQAGNGTNLILSDLTATNAQRFYRVRRW